MEVGIFAALTLVVVSAAALAILSPDPAKVGWGLVGALLATAGLMLLLAGYDLAVALGLGAGGLGAGLACLKLQDSARAALFARETYGVGLVALGLALVVMGQVDWAVPAAVPADEPAFAAVGPRLYAIYWLPLQSMGFILLTVAIGIAVFYRAAERETP